MSARLSLPVALQEREELLNYSGNIHPIYYGHNTPGWLAFRKLVLSIDPGRQSDPYVRFPPYGRRGLSLREVFDVARQFDRVTLAAFLQYFQPDRFISGFVLESKSEQAPNPESRVTLDYSRDAFGLNRVKLNWRMLPIDRRTVVRAEEIIGEELQRLGIGTLAPLDPAEVEGWPANLEGGRADDDPKRGVVDADGKMHGMANLFVAGSSVFPTAGAAPPTLTIVAMALRLAGHLRRKLGVRPAAPAELAAPAANVAERAKAAPALVSRSRA